MTVEPDHLLVHPAIEAALTVPAEPNLYRRLGWIASVAEVGAHVPEYAAFWRAEAERVVAAPRPCLVVLGDSLAQGIGASSPATSYAGRLRTHLSAGGPEVPVLNLSRSGARIADVLDTQLPALEAAGVAPLAVVCNIGSNDILHSFHLLQIRAAFVALLDALPERAIVATLPERGSRVGSAMNRVIRSRAAAAGRPVADVGRLLRTWRGRVSGDRFHPNDAGYAVWFDAFAAALPVPAAKLDLRGT